MQEVCQKVLALLEDKKDVRFGQWNAKEVEIINPLQLLSAKPVVYLVNMSEANYIKKRDRWLGPIKTWVDAHGGEPILPFSAQFEAKVSSEW